MFTYTVSPTKHFVIVLCSHRILKWRIRHSFRSRQINKFKTIFENHRQSRPDSGKKWIRNNLILCLSQSIIDTSSVVHCFVAVQIVHKYYAIIIWQNRTSCCKQLTSQTDLWYKCKQNLMAWSFAPTCSSFSWRKKHQASNNYFFLYCYYFYLSKLHWWSYQTRLDHPLYISRDTATPPYHLGQRPHHPYL